MSIPTISFPQPTLTTYYRNITVTSIPPWVPNCQDIIYVSRSGLSVESWVQFPNLYTSRVFCLPRLLLSCSPTPTHPPSHVILFLPFESFQNFITLTKANHLLFQCSLFSSSLYFFDSSFFLHISSVFRTCVIHFFRKCEMSLTEYIMEDDFSKQSRHTNDHKLEREKERRIKGK